MIISHLSPSSLLLYLKNPADFYQKYVLNIRDQKTNPAALTGTAFHKYAQAYLSNAMEPLEQAKNVILYARDVEWGKTGSPEKCLDELNKLIKHFHAQEPYFDSVVATEYGEKVKVKQVKLPIKGFIDAVVERGDETWIVDWKTVKSYDDAPKPSYLIQAFFYKWLVEKTLRRKVTGATFIQLKASQNQDGSPQVRELPIRFDGMGKEEKAVATLANNALKEMARKTKVFLPNPNDEFGGEEAWRLYVELINK